MRWHSLLRKGFELGWCTKISSLRVAEKEKLYPLRSSSQKRLSEGCRLQIIMGGALALALALAIAIALALALALALAIALALALARERYS